MFYGEGRKKLRLEGFDYGNQGYYFVTFCTKGRIDYFGEIIDGEMLLNDYGKGLKDVIEETREMRKCEIEFDEYIIMPNHVHIIVIKNDHGNQNERGKERLQSFPTCEMGIFDNRGALGLKGNNISGVIRGIKGSTTRNIRQNYGDYEFAWQKSFFDVIIRNQDQLDKTREYIKLNPSKWAEDVNNSKNIKPGKK